MMTGNVAVAFLALLANSSGFLLLGLFAAGLVHALAHRFESLQRLIPRGLKAIALGIIAGFPLPVCSCGVVPIAVALKRRHAHPETVASFVVSTPETSLDAVGLTAALFGLPFALFRVLAGLTAALLAGIFVIATEAWPPAQERDGGNARDHDLDVIEGHPPPEWWERLVAWIGRTAREWLGPSPTPAQTSAPPEARTPTEPESPSIRRRFRRPIVAAMRVGFVETLDEISWMLLFGFALSAAILVFLPDDFASRIPGGITGQTLFGLAISLPLYVCASSSIPLAAALMTKGLSPVAVMTIFLVGPLTNPATLLLLSRSFGRRFVAALVLAGFLAAIAFGSIVATLVKAPAGQTPLEIGQAASVGGWDIFFTIIFLPIFVLSLARAGLRRGTRDIREAVTSILPADLREAVHAAVARLWSLKRELGWIALGALTAGWLLSGCAVIPEGTVGFTEVFGKAGERPLPPGLHWTLPGPFGHMRVVDAGALIHVSVGFRMEPDEQRTANDSAVFTPAADSGWHSIYTSSGSRPEESTYVTGELNLVETKAGIHLLISDPRAFAYQGGDPIETVRSMYQASLRELLASRSIDETLTSARSSIEQAALLDLQRRLIAAHIPLRVVSVSLLDLHPPDAAVYAFRDISSALEDRETRIHQARGKADAALPSARGAAAAMMASAESDRRENVARASGVSTAFAVQADIAKRSGPAVRSMLRWNALDRLFAGKRLVLVPHGTARDLVDMPLSGGSF
jgi:uncharacterized membrane protein YraQ (UPF0718 family)/regulator of protease activity HflC (stomatin/prohibitin superfamily)